MAHMRAIVKARVRAMDNSNVSRMGGNQRVGRAQRILAAYVLVSAATCLAQTYVISTVAGGAPPVTPFSAGNVAIGAPQNVATDTTGNVYFTSLNCVFELFRSGTLVQIAGNSRAGYSGDGGPAVNAQLWAPIGLAVDAAGDVFIADTGNNRVRKVAVNGIITTVAGNGAPGFAGDGGPAASAGLSGVAGVAVDSSGNLFIADSGNNRVRKVTTSGVITTVAGNGTAAAAGDGGNAVIAQLSATSVALDGLGDIFIGATLNYRVREVSTTGIITTVAGAGTPGFSGDGGSARGAQLSVFHQIAVDPNGNLYIADSGNSCIREVTASGLISTIVGTGRNAYYGDNGPASGAALAFPFGVTLDPQGDIVIADTSNNRIRAVFTDGTIGRVAGNGQLSYSGDGGTATSAQLSSPQGLALDRFGNLFVADASNNRVAEVMTSGIISTVAGNTTQGFLGDDDLATSAELSTVTGVAADLSGNLFIADSGNFRVREVSANTISTLAGNGNSAFAGNGVPAVSAALSVGSVAVDVSGNVVVGDPVNFRVRKITTDGNINTVAGIGTKGYSGDNGPALGAPLSGVSGVAVDSSGNLFIADSGNNCIREVSTSGTITTVAGNGAAGFSGDGGLATSAQLRNPSAVAVDAAGNIFIADTNNNRVRRVSTTGIITTLAGNGGASYTGDGGAGPSATLSLPSGLVITKAGNVYVSDTGNNAIRLLTPTNQAVFISAVVDAASESAVPVSPGKIVVIYGTGLGPAQLVVNQPVNGVFGPQVAGTTVSFRGVSAPMYYTSANQVAAIVPYEISGSASVPVVVSYQGQLSSPFTAAFAAAAPGFFTSNATGAGQAAAVNVVDGTLNSAANPVKIGSYISFYATGEGQTTPGGVDGKLASGPVYPAPQQKVSVTVGGVAATFNYAGAAPGAVAGLMQVNVLIPAGVTPGGYVPVVLTVGSASTVNGAVSIAVSN